ncbi:MAG: hypothetical protein NC187_01520 [Candidatus Amulumruptor caecigallinarius]|nr:hypothetical protein [Candidatus Amulumruptor caecigallinarius]MCM1396154.1 hypothetical protein [Candidatus Amulumruptor caecigallinarius]MCM1453846.1 hypothetical protein [bacterium]
MNKQILLATVTAMALASCSSDDKDIPADTPVASGTYVARVVNVDYRPAPGQFINEMPEYVAGDNATAMNVKCRNILNREDGLISLGSFGGSVTMELEQPVVNHHGSGDFKVMGNAFAGNAEPGIVEVSADGANWYSLKGEKWGDSQAAFTVTYYRPADDATDENYIKWEGSDGTSGWINRVASHHTQPFFPQWGDQTAASVTFTARRLPDNASFNSGNGQYTLAPYWGYADSYPNTSDESWLHLDNAVDATGAPVNLTSVSYIRITTSVLAANGALGEESTEISHIVVRP